MIICFNCSPDIKNKMDNMLITGEYGDYSELITVAISNLWLLDQEFAEKNAVVIGEKSQLSSIVTTSQLSPAAKANPTTSQLKKASRKQSIIQFAIPDLFLSIDLSSPVATLDTKFDESTPNEFFMLDQWLFGQYNKLLPLKANCRAISHLTTKHKNGVPLEEGGQIAKAAMLLRDYLADHDARHKISRDDAFATAFPHNGSGAEKSCARYINQFIGSINSQGVLSGLLWDYHLVGLVPEKVTRLLLTEEGVKLARLSNPILDGCQTEPSQKFSSEEITFLLDHIRSYVPVEKFAFQALIQAIADGANTPQKLDEVLLRLVPTDSTRSLSPSFLTSQRSGALSRMADLDLIIRVRDGVKVSYVLTDRGQSFID